MVLLRYFVVFSCLRDNNVTPILSTFDFIIVVVSTLLVAGGGYIINDYYDVSTDKINKPEGVIVGTIISPETAQRIYLIFSALGLFGGFFCGLAPVFILMVALLWLYSFRLKKIAILGNLCVALLIWLSAYLVVTAELQNLSFISPLVAQEVRLYGLGFGLFAGVSTLGREIIKDAEDIEGDRQNNCRTLPIIAGENTTKGVIVFIELLLIAMVVFTYFCASRISFTTRLSTYLLLFIILPTFLVIVRVIMAQEKSDYTRISRLTKLVMLCGILCMVIIC